MIDCGINWVRCTANLGFTVLIYLVQIMFVQVTGQIIVGDIFSAITLSWCNILWIYVTHSAIQHPHTTYQPWHLSACTLGWILNVYRARKLPAVLGRMGNSESAQLFGVPLSLHLPLCLLLFAADSICVWFSPSRKFYIKVLFIFCLLPFKI